MARGHKSKSKTRPLDVAADTKRNFIPIINANYLNVFPPYSILYRQPATQLETARRKPSTRPPAFYFTSEDPVMTAISYANMDSQTSEAAGGGRVRIPFICSANESRPGGDWETGCAGYEERLCRRSNLSATLSSPWPHTGMRSNYPIPSLGAILSDSVVVCRGPHDRYEKLERWHDLPVVSVPPVRYPKLKESGLEYSFSEEREIMREKMRGALRICLYHNYDRVVICDFGLGSNRNPPQLMAEMWRDVLLFDPHVRGQFAYVIFAFDDSAQSTRLLILQEMAKREMKACGSKGLPRSHPLAPTTIFKNDTATTTAAATGSSSSSSALENVATDMSIFQQVFGTVEIQRVLSAPDPRYGLAMITS